MYVQNLALTPMKKSTTQKRENLPLLKNDTQEKAVKQIKFKGFPNPLKSEYLKKLLPPYSESGTIANLLAKFGKIPKIDGEVGSILVNAFGTLFVAAPIIAWTPTVDIVNFFKKINPFTKNENKKYSKKEKKENRYYSALRQPVSAFLAVTMQIFMSAVGKNLIKSPAGKGLLGEAMINPALQGGVSCVFGLILSLATLPLQVEALNWIYPKFVKLVAPGLSKDKNNAPKKNETAKTGGKQ